MAAKKKPAKKKQKSDSAIRAFIANTGEWFRWTMATALAEHTWRVVGGVALVGVVTAWAVARGPLMDKVGTREADPVRIAFDWPATESGDVWLPPAVRADLERIAHATVSMNPFDRESLERTALELEKTGWLSNVTSVRRLTGGEVRISGAWRAHAAVVVKDSRRYLVGTGAELLKGPAGMDISRMYTITEPRAQVPTRRDGTVAYGMPWLGAVDESIALLRAVDGLPGSARIAGVDLTSFARDGRLVLVTDGGSRIVWGSAIGDESPGEAASEQKIANLKRILANGDDTRHRVLEIVLPRVEIDVRSGG